MEKISPKIRIEIICFLFTLLFAYAATSKLIDIEQFQIQIGQSPLLTKFSTGVSWGIPGIEILIAASLVIPSARLIGLYASFGLMIMFTAYIVSILNFQGNIPCSCGGILEVLGWKEHLIFNIGFVLLSLYGIVELTKTRNSKTQKPVIPA